MEERCAERINISANIDIGDSACLLWSNIGRRAHHRSRLGHAIIARRKTNQSQVSQLGHAMISQKNIRGLDVTMHQTSGLNRLQTARRVFQ